MSRSASALLDYLECEDDDYEYYADEYDEEEEKEGNNNTNNNNNNSAEEGGDTSAQQRNDDDDGDEDEDEGIQLGLAEYLAHRERSKLKESIELMEARVVENEGSLLDNMQTDYTVLAPKELREMSEEEADFARSYQLYRLQQEKKTEAAFAHYMNLKLKDAVSFSPAITAQRMAWKTLPTEGFVACYSHAAVAVPIQGKMYIMMFGGSEAAGNPLSVCQLYNVEKKTWKVLPIEGKQPTARTGHSMVLDSKGRIIVIGGSSVRSGRLNDVHVLHGLPNLKRLHWNHLHKANWMAENDVTEYDSPRSVTGWCTCDPAQFWNGPGMHNWNYDKKRKRKYFWKDHWMPYFVSDDSDPLPPISHHSCVARGQRMIVFGGFNNRGASNDVYVLTFKAPSMRSSSDTQWYSLARRTHTVNVNLKGVRQGELVWVKTSTFGDVPAPRAAHSAVLINQHQMLVIGGTDGKREFHDAYVLELSTWTWRRIKLRGAPLPPICYHSATKVANNVLIFGGYSRTMPMSNTLILDTATWTLSQVNIAGAAPSARGSHSATVVGDSLVLSSGFAKATIQPSVHVLENVFDTSGFQSSLGLDLLKAFKEEIATDVSFLVEDKVLCAHRAILSARSKVFRNLFADADTPDLIKIDGDSFIMWKHALGYLYSDTISLTLALAKPLMEFSRKYELPQLESIAQSCFQPTLIPPSRLTNDMEWVYSTGAFSDLIVEVEGRSFACHKVVLCARSDYFANMLNSGFREEREQRVTIHDVAADIFAAVLAYVYTDHLDAQNVQHSFDLLCEGDIFAMPVLKDRCEQNLLSAVDMDNVGVLLDAADTYHAMVLKSACMNFLLRYYHAVLGTGVLEALSSSLRAELRALRKQQGYYLLAGEDEQREGSSDEAEQDAALYKDVEGVLCDECALPFVYLRNEWPEGQLTPKELVHNWVGAQFKGCQQPKYAPVLDVAAQQLGHVAQITLYHTEPPTVLQIPRPYSTKRQAEQNAALFAWHTMKCGKVQRESGAKR